MCISPLRCKNLKINTSIQHLRSLKINLNFQYHETFFITNILNIIMDAMCYLDAFYLIKAGAF